MNYNMFKRKHISQSLMTVASLLISLTVLAQKTVNIRDFGAIPNDNKDDFAAFQQLINTLENAPGNYIVLIPKGDYHLFKPISTTRGLKQNIAFKGEKGTRIIIRGYGGGSMVAASAQTVLLQPVSRNQNSISVKLPPAFKVEAGDLVHLQSNTPFEEAWKYKENDIHRITSISGNQIGLASDLLFNYDNSRESVVVTIYKKCALNFSNIAFVLEPDGGKKKGVETMLGLKGVSADFRNVSFEYTGKEDFYHLGLSIAASENLYFDNIFLKNLQYGILMNYCRNIKGYNTKADACRHAYTPTQACYNVYVENLNGIRCQSVLDAHVSFKVHYNKVRDTLATQLPNCRSLGTIIENTRISMTGNYNQMYAYWSVQTLTPEYAPMYGEYDTRFNNVYWVSKTAGSFNGLNSYSCRKLIVENCTTHSVSYYGDQTLQRVEIRNSRIGAIRIDANKVLVENTVMDGSLIPGASFVFRFIGKGDCRLDGITVKNYDPRTTYLFDYEYNVPGFGGITIANSNIGALKGWVKTIQYPGRPGNKVSVEASMITDFKDKYPAEFSTLPQVINAAKSKYRKQ